MNKIKIQFLVGFLCAFGMAGCMPSKTQTITRSTTTAVVDPVNRNDVDSVFIHAYRWLQPAYHKALSRNKDLEGRLTIRLNIRPNGTVANVSVVSSTLNDAALEKRLLDIIKSLRFSDGNFKEWSNTYTLNFVAL